jgi:hypothetical protein
MDWHQASRVLLGRPLRVPVFSVNMRKQRTLALLTVCRQTSPQRAPTGVFFTSSSLTAQLKKVVMFFRYLVTVFGLIPQAMFE